MSHDPPILTAQQARRIDQVAIDEYGISSLVLMENAGRGTADTLCALGVNGLVAICCGKGNNAGDGFVIARHLDLRGLDVAVITWFDPGEMRGDALTNYRVLQHTGVRLTSADESNFRATYATADWVVDALLGTGAVGEPRSPVRDAILAINDLDARCLAVDLPSGLDADSGDPSSVTVRADHTCTFVGPKRGFSSPQAQSFVGQVHVVDIGIKIDPTQSKR